MLEYNIALRRSDGQEWMMTDATTMQTMGQDIVTCIHTGDTFRVVMRFLAPSWEEARKVFHWKATYDFKVPKDVLEWEVARLMAERRPVCLSPVPSRRTQTTSSVTAPSEPK